MAAFSRRQHLIRAVIGIGSALVLGFGPALGLYYDENRERLWLWLLLMFSTLPVLGWGASHLARYRGYPASGGCALCFVGYVVSGFVGTTNPHPLAFGLGVVFTV